MPKRQTRDKAGWLDKHEKSVMARMWAVALFSSIKSDRNLHKLVCVNRARPPPTFDLISKNQIGGKERMVYIKAKAEKKWKEIEENRRTAASESWHSGGCDRETAKSRLGGF